MKNNRTISVNERDDLIKELVEALENKDQERFIRLATQLKEEEKKSS